MQAYHRVQFAFGKSSQKSAFTTAHQAAHCGADTVSAASNSRGVSQLDVEGVTAGDVCSEMCMFQLRLTDMEMWLPECNCGIHEKW
jgi:hypothetical protein